ncbi:OprO/OprP family phosphate-selective porin [Salinibacter altiplanensis]|uniref:OprO/OprP family phosphate-selective porin n=1 Tax=Salinibacter altiplanensis TaxID=1803181 RepID=UPI000C9F2136|nr:porin [Salinibacter altiplanensis]
MTAAQSRLLVVFLTAMGLVGFGHEGRAQTVAEPGASGTVQVGEEGFRVASEDGAFALRMRGDLYADARFFLEQTAPPGAEGFLLRRVRPRFQGRVYDRFAFSIRSDFGTGGPEIDDAFVEARFAPALTLRMGRFKVPVGLETLSSTTGLMHVERGFPAGLVPGRDVGVSLSGTVGTERLRYAVGLFNGTPGASEPGADVDDAKEGAGRLFATPFAGTGGGLEGLGVGVAGTVGTVTGTEATPALTGLSTTGRQSFFGYRDGVRADGRRWRLAPQARFYTGPVELLGEYTLTTEAVRHGPATETLTHRAWQASAAVVVTGEKAREGTVAPRDPFGAERGTGAIELGARLHGATLDDEAFPTFASPTAASQATAWGLTVSWYPNALVRFMLGVERTWFEAAGGASPPDAETLVLTRMQIAF